MKEKAAKIIAIIALVFMGIFTITLIMVFVDFGGTVTTVLTFVCGGIGIALFFVMKFLMKKSASASEVDGQDRAKPFDIHDLEEPDVITKEVK